MRRHGNVSDDIKSPTQSRDLPDEKQSVHRVPRIEYKALPTSQFYPIKSTPILPEGWDWWVDEENRVFYIDMCSGHDAKRCFWEPPIPEQLPGKVPPIGWSRVETLAGRVSWLHIASGLRSYVFPTHNPYIRFRWNGFTEMILLKGAESFVDLAYVSKQDRVLEDEGVACQITRKVWDTGLSEEVRACLGSWIELSYDSDTIVATGDNLLENRNLWLGNGLVPS